METQIFNTDELRSTFPLRADPLRDAEILGQLLQDPDIHIQVPFQAVGFHEYHGEVLVGAESILLKFHHKGSQNGARLSALRCSHRTSVAAVRLLRQVILQNAAQNTLGIVADRPAFKAQPEQLRVRIKPNSRGGRDGKSSSGTPHQESVGYWGERHFMAYLERHCPQAKIEWHNANEEAGLPYDILLEDRLAFDVKATRIERGHVDLSEAEGEFRRRVGGHHGVALVTLGDDKKASPLAIDLYVGVPLVRSDLDTVQRLLADLPVLQHATAGHSTLTNDVEVAPAYFLPGRYASPSTILDFKPDGQFAATGSEKWSGHYQIAGHFIVLRPSTLQSQTVLDKLHIVTDGDSRWLATPDGEVYLLQF